MAKYISRVRGPHSIQHCPNTAQTLFGFQCVFGVIAERLRASGVQFLDRDLLAQVQAIAAMLIYGQVFHGMARNASLLPTVTFRP